MPYLKFLAVIFGRASDDAVLRTAAVLARQFQAPIKVVVAPPAHGPLSGSPYQTRERLAEIEEAATGAARTAVRAAAEAEGVRFGAGRGACLDLSPRRLMLPLEIGHDLPLIDLIVMDNESACGEKPGDAVFGDALFSWGAPIMVARVPPPDFKRICVSWDGSPRAARAVRAALPMMQASDEVVVLQATRGLTEVQQKNPNSAPEPLRYYLEDRGVDHTVEMRVDDTAEGPGFTAAIRNLESGLLVAGACGRLHRQELVLGGATHAFVHMTGGPPLLLSN